MILSQEGREGGGLSKSFGSSIELDQLDRKGKSDALVNREIRKAHKKNKKLQELIEREEMKFSHSVQFNAVPDWSSHYISYSNLKKL